MQPQTKKPLFSSNDAKMFGLLLMPSWLSTVMTVFSSAVVTAGVIILSRFEGSQLHLDYISYKAGSSTDTTAQVSQSGLISNPIIGNLPLLFFWGLIGLVVYMFAANIIGTLQHAADLHDEMNYVHADRDSIKKVAFEKLIIRAVVLAIWIPYIFWFFHHLLSYVIAAALAGSAQLGSLSGILYVFVGALVLYVALNMHVLLFRLLLLRPRAFAKSMYI